MSAFRPRYGTRGKVPGATAHHALGVLDLVGPTVELVSNAVRLEFLP